MTSNGRGAEEAPDEGPDHHEYPGYSDPIVRWWTGGPPRPVPPPLEINTVPVVATTTVLWFVAFLVLLPFRERMAEAGNGDWVWVCLAAAGLGLLGTWYCVRRDQAIRRDAQRRDDQRRDDQRRAATERTPGTGRQPGSGTGTAGTESSGDQGA
ncbi:DUF2530 domain-containing protein [Allostreptomyces psammosilenae]|uniref:DUF2530 domain-containing protein n=1 Tax=Allostreptomyces psammosilenae TaxID=1892865 RepID=A0A852ZZX6_9ACTN|nr:DUF2530 domain-containing protein [Allostreptomyces psammosilenae]NYI07699.1 hypothetical protein [Allostreptomyces psammosilenae]